MKYTEGDTRRILAAYNKLFEEPNAELIKFMDFSRNRTWSCLTSDFRTLTFEKFREFDRQINDLSLSSKSTREIGECLVELSRSVGVGYSMGLCPWTDYLLLNTFKNTSKEIIIVVGHNWYPIVTKDKCYVADSPLNQDNPTCDWRYAKALPSQLLDCPELAVLFVNLNPDFLPPGDNKTGDTNTAQFIPGFAGICKSVSKVFRIKAVVSWGSPVWQSLLRCLKSDRSIPNYTNVGAAVLERNLALSFDELEIKYYPFLHPSSPSFHGKEHSQRYRDICDELLSV